LLLVQNNHERNKPTNTGRLVERVIEEAEILRYAVRGESFDPTALQRDDLEYRLIFPRQDARELELDATRLDTKAGQDHGTKQICWVLLDGTWGQCSRMSRRVPGLAEMPAYRLPPGPPGHWGVRKADDPARISTFEAAIRLVEGLHGPSAARGMHDFFDRLAAAMLFMKGKLRSPEVPTRWPIVGGVDESETT
jgi:DTW domain-containing protein YfiP